MMYINDGSTPEESAKNVESFDSAFDKTPRFFSEILGSDITIRKVAKNLGGLKPILDEIGGAAGGPAAEGISKLTGFLSTMATIGVNAIEEFMQFEQEAFKTFDTFGVGTENVEHFKATLYDAGREMTTFSKKAGDPLNAFKMAAKIQEEYNKALRTNSMLSQETLVSVQKASELTNVSSSNLVANFTAAGKSLTNVGKEMETAAKTIIGMGMNVGGVSEQVSKYIGKLDLYNFKGGVEGLAKMAAESARLGVNMEKVFAKTDELMNPDKAMEFASSLQRLGLGASELANPLRTLFLAENDPEEFTKQLAKTTEALFEFDEATGEAKLIKGNRRLIKEMATLYNMGEEDVVRMGKRYSEMAEIKAQLGQNTTFNDKDIELIQGLAKYEPGKGFVVEFTDKEGKKEQKLITELNEGDKAQIESQYLMKSTDETIKKQLSSNELMNTLLYGILDAATELVVLSKTGNKLSKEFRKEGEKGGILDNLKDFVRVNMKTLREDEGKADELKKKLEVVAEPFKKPPAADFVFREDGGIQQFSKGDLIMGIDQESLTKAPKMNNLENNPIVNSIVEKDSKFEQIKETLNNVIQKNTVGGEITLKVDINSNTMDEEKIRRMLSDTGTIQELNTKIKQAVSNFNLT